MDCIAPGVCASGVRQQVTSLRPAREQFATCKLSSPELSVEEAIAIRMPDIIGGDAAYACPAQDLASDLVAMSDGLLQDLPIFEGHKKLYHNLGATNCPASLPIGTSPRPHSEPQQDSGTRTTILLQRILPNSTQQDVRDMLVSFGFAGTFDVIDVPLNRQRTANLGYAFVNFMAPESAKECLGTVDGRKLPGLTGRRRCRAAYSKMQGAALARNVAWSNGVKLGGADISANTRNQRQGKDRPVPASARLGHGRRPVAMTQAFSVAGGNTMYHPWLVTSLPPVVVCGAVVSL
mmetsp:Transcript_79971/g.232186  ORF Transcript_79971/g.232186 Transcript_79971/m.232186 type:complete len:292 (+) Transcript_79971:108-983(+)